ncbi:MAG: glutamate formimidoyltransferase [Elusimicrobiaceae bacterium]|nr:glutamate formimidoyltransferase [Elusimicrobiaceae bacterium]
MPLIEWVPNFSEGRDLKKVNAIADYIKANADIILLGKESGADVNRSVFTFVGEKEEVFKAALACVEIAVNLIDMRKQKGKHFRLGALDVCPFIPLKNATMQDCIMLAKAVAEYSGKIGIPSYLYGAAATTKERQSLAFIRKGQYESLEEKLKTLPPDFGPCKFTEQVKKSGAFCFGARDFLIAYNINLDTKNLDTAKQIAKTLRAKTPYIKTTAWFIKEYDLCQVSINIEDYKKTPILFVFNECKKIAKNFNINAFSSELIGFAPQESFCKQGQDLDTIIKELGLDYLKPFNKKEHILPLELL